MPFLLIPVALAAATVALAIVAGMALLVAGSAIPVNVHLHRLAVVELAEAVAAARPHRTPEQMLRVMLALQREAALRELL